MQNIKFYHSKNIIIIISFLLLFNRTSYSQETLEVTEDRPKIALVLGGGGARGIAHVGVLKVLEEYRIPIDYIVGTSMGSIVGAGYSTGMSPKVLEKTLTVTDWKDLFNDKPTMANLDFRQKREQRRYLHFEMGFEDWQLKLPPGFVAGQKLDFLLKSFSPLEGVETFEEFAIPFKAVATNVETGKAVILKEGDLAESIRASMAVAGAFTPVEIDGIVLMDGGYTKNVPIDIALKWKPDLIIVVDVGIPLKTKSDLNNLGDYNSQLTNIMFLNEAKRQHALLREQDILIQPDLGETSVLDFGKAAEIVAMGEEAAYSLAEKLKNYSISEEEYKIFLVNQRYGTKEKIFIDFIEYEEPERVSVKQIQGRMKTKPGQYLNLKQLQKDLNRVYTIGDFDKVDFDIIEKDGKTGLRIEAHEREWGPNYVKVGVNLKDNLNGDTFFNMLGMFKRTQINELGGEWRFEPVIGENLGFTTDFYQPLDYGDTFFINPIARIQRDTTDYYNGNDRIARYRSWFFDGGFIAGMNLGTYARIYGGYRGGTTVSDRFIGTGVPDGTIGVGEILATAQYDTMDAAYFPKTGAIIELNYVKSMQGLGAKESYDKILFELFKAVTFKEKHTFMVSTRWGTNFNTDIPIYDQFAIGGFLNMGGYNPNQERGQHVGYVGGLYYYKLKEFDGVFLRDVYIGGTLETGKAWEDKDEIDLAKLHYGATAFLGLDTLIGPIYMGYGVADRSEEGQFFLYVGQIF